MKRKRYILIFVLLLLGTVCNSVYAQEAKKENLIIPRDIPAVAVEIYGTKEEILNQLKDVTYTLYTEDETLTVPVKWDLSSVNMNQKGVYKIKGNPENGQTGQIQTMVSVQSRDTPDINAWYRLTAAGIYIFPWLDRSDTEEMSVWIKKAGGLWIDLTEGGYAICDSDGLYLSNQSMSAGNTYFMTVRYGKSMTRILKFAYCTDGDLKIYSYTQGEIGNIWHPSNCIASYEKEGEKFLTRCGAYAISSKDELKKIKDELENDQMLKVSTASVYEDTPENPALLLKSAWNISEVNTERPGLYKIEGIFKIPEDYVLKQGFTLPKAYAYISVQKKDAPQIDTYYMPAVHVVLFPMVTDGFSSDELQKFEIYLRKNKGSYKKLKKDQAVMTSRGVELYCDTLEGQNSYELCVVHTRGSTGIYSFVYDDAFITNEFWHQRNFADREERKLPDIIQTGPGKTQAVVSTVPAQTPDTEDETERYSYESSGQRNGSEDKKSESTSVPLQISQMPSSAERVTDTVTVITGRRLALMLSQNGFARFEKNGIVFTIPKQVAEDWKLGDTEELQVMIEKISDRGFSIRLFIRNEEIAEVPGATVQIPLDQFGEELSGQEVTVKDTEENFCECSLEQGILKVMTDRTGDYFLQSGEEESPVQSEFPEEDAADAVPESVRETADEAVGNNGNFKMLVIIGGILCFTGIYTVKKFRQKRK